MFINYHFFNSLNQKGGLIKAYTYINIYFEIMRPINFVYECKSEKIPFVTVELDEELCNMIPILKEEMKRTEFVKKDLARIKLLGPVTMACVKPLFDNLKRFLSDQESFNSDIDEILLLPSVSLALYLKLPGKFTSYIVEKAFDSYDGK